MIPFALLCSRAPRLRAARALALLWLVLFWSGSARALKVLVKGAASLEGQVQTDGSAQIIRGKLRDDLGGPISKAQIHLEALQSDGKPLTDFSPPRPCTGGTPLPFKDGGYATETDAQGVFCLRTARLPQRGLLRLRFTGSSGLAGVRVEVPFDAEHPTAMLGWDPKPEQIDLDVPQARVAVAMSGLPSTGSSIPMELLDERGKVIATADTDDRGRALFEVATTELAGPGAGELTARPRGASAGGIQAKVVRTARVTLVGSAPKEAIVPHDGHRFQIAAETQRGPAERGVVEVRLGNEILGAGTIKAGRVDVTAAFDVPAEGAIDLTFRYLPSSPGLREAEPLVLRVPVRPPSPLRKAPLLLLGVLLLGWLARGWKRPPRAQRPAAPKPTEETTALPEMSAEPEEGASGWQGVVLDAHERRPLVGAVVRVLGRDFYGEREVEQVHTDGRGRFQLQTSWAPTHLLQVTSPWHTTVERPLPKPGRLALALVSRRRTLLERLVAVGKKFVPEQSQEPTPEQLARRFESDTRPGGARWARELEATVFGQEPVGVKEEARLSDLEADLARRDPGDGVRR